MGCLVLTEAEVQRIRRQLEEFPWYRQFCGVSERVDEWIARKPEIPVEKGRAFWESCPNDGTLLVFDPYDRSITAARSAELIGQMRSITVPGCGSFRIGCRDGPSRRVFCTVC